MSYQCATCHRCIGPENEAIVDILMDCDECSTKKKCACDHGRRLQMRYQLLEGLQDLRNRLDKLIEQAGGEVFPETDTQLYSFSDEEILSALTEWTNAGANPGRLKSLLAAFKKQHATPPAAKTAEPPAPSAQSKLDADLLEEIAHRLYDLVASTTLELLDALTYKNADGYEQPNTLQFCPQHPLYPQQRPEWRNDALQKIKLCRWITRTAWADVKDRLSMLSKAESILKLIRDHGAPEDH